MNALARLAHARGLEIEYYDALGRHRRASDESVLAVLRALGEPITRADEAEALLTRPVERASVVVLWDGRGELEVAHADGRVTVEGVSDLGERWEIRAEVRGGRATLEGVPPGVHDALVSGAHAWILSAPTRSYGESSRRWGLFAPLYALHDRTTPDAGDFGTLGRALDATLARGGDCFATLPLLPVFAERNEPSPYAPVSRLFWNELYVDPRAAGPELEASASARRLLENVPAQGDYLDWVSLASHRFAILDALAEACVGERRARLEAWAIARPHLPGYVERRIARMDDPAKAAHTIRYAQWLADEQLAGLGARGGLYVDLPLGVHHDGYDAWRFADRFAPGISTGAPPDPLFEGGQSWGFPPLHPEADRATGWSYLRQCLEHHMRHASVLRIDHAAWLHRLYWVPNGAPATDGVYVHHTNPDELHALLSLLSHRHACRLVGEDLGTVPDAVRTSMARHAEARTWVFYFFAHDWGWEAPPEGSVATLNTHDLPTFAGWCGSTDVDDWVDLGLYDAPRAEEAKVERAKLVSDLKRCLSMDEDASPRAMHDRIATAVAEGPGDLLLLTLEDLCGEERPQNVPGTFDEKPNWMRRATEGLESLEKPENEALFAALRERRPRG